jgi:hypothetical protein
MIVLAQKSGQLGNRLFQYAHFIAFSLDSGIPILNPSFGEYARFFDASSKFGSCAFPPDCADRLGSMLTRHYRVAQFLFRCGRALRIRNRFFSCISLSDGEAYSLDDRSHVESLRASRVVAVGGWLFRGEQAFRKHSDAIREYFTLAEAHRLNVAALIDRARVGCNVLIGIHMRRGDYARWENGRYFYTPAQYAAKMRQAAALFPEQQVGFLVCSNEPVDSSEFDGMTVHFGTGHPVEDMYAFALCDYLIGPPSTFSLWASFYGVVPLYSLERPDDPVSLESFTSGAW